MKEYIRTATAYLEGKRCGLQVFSPMTDAVRMDQSQSDNTKTYVIINNQWNYPELGLGNYIKRAPEGSGQAMRVASHKVE